MFATSFGEDEMDDLFDRQAAGHASKNTDSYYFTEDMGAETTPERMSSPSEAIPIATSNYSRPGGLMNMMNLSGDSNDSNMSIASSYPNQHPAGNSEMSHVNVGQYVAASAAAHSLQQPQMTYEELSRGKRTIQNMSFGMRKIPATSASPFVGSLPHDPYPSPVNHHLSHPNRTQDHLSMVYGQSCPEPSYSSIPGFKQMKFPMDPLNALFPQHTPVYSPDSYIGPSLPTSNAPMTMGQDVAGSLFQFRTTHPASADQIMEKQKKRKESHNAVERRRRDHINEMIQQLGMMVEDGTSGEAGRLNKGEILQRAVERIRYLERIVELQRDRLGLVDPNFKIEDLLQPEAPGEP